MDDFLSKYRAPLVIIGQAYSTHAASSDLLMGFDLLGQMHLRNPFVANIKLH